MNYNIENKISNLENQISILNNKIANLVKRIDVNDVSAEKAPYKLTSIKQEKGVQLLPYGMICNPIFGSEGVAFSMSGSNERMFIVPYNPEITPDAEKGDVIIFSNKTTKITLKLDGLIKIETPADVEVECDNLKATCQGDIDASCVNMTATCLGNIVSTCQNTTTTCTTKATITAPDIEANGNLLVTGTLTVNGIATLIGATTIQSKPFLAHTHSGVTSGISNTGVVV